MGNVLRSLQELLRQRQRARILRLSFPRGGGPASEPPVNKLEATEGLSRNVEFTVNAPASSTPQLSKERCFLLHRCFRFERRDPGA